MPELRSKLRLLWAIAAVVSGALAARAARDYLNENRERRDRHDHHCGADEESEERSVAPLQKARALDQQKTGGEERGKSKPIADHSLSQESSAEQPTDPEGGTDPAEDAEQLEIRWSAFTARRGPVAFNRNAIKLASLLTDEGEPGHEEKAAAALVAEVLGLAWRLEGNDLENAATAKDDNTPREPEVETLIETLQQVSAAATAAVDRLSSYARVP